MGMLPRCLLRVLPDKNTPDFWSNRLRPVLHFLGIFSSSNLRGVYRGKAAVTFEDGVGGAADFVEKAQAVLLSVRGAKWAI